MVDQNLLSYFLGRIVFMSNEGVLTVHKKQLNFIVSILARLELPKRYQLVNELQNNIVNVNIKTCHAEVSSLLNGNEPNRELYLRGLYEGYANGKVNELMAMNAMKDWEMFKNLEFTSKTEENGQFIMAFKDKSAFLKTIYKNYLEVGSHYYLEKSKYHMKQYTKKTKNNVFYYCLKETSAVAPSKTRESDAGYDLTLISVNKVIGNTTFYDTGVALEPPKGMYFDLVPRSSISKTGYVLANSIGIIDNEYRGNVLVALTKLDKDAPDLTLPNRLVQIIPRYSMHLECQPKEELVSTERDTKGFGSSNKPTETTTTTTTEATEKLTEYVENTSLTMNH